MRSPRTVTMREWLIRLCNWETHGRCPRRTSRALARGGWATILGNGTIAHTDLGRAWLAAWLFGEKSIGGQS